MIRILAQRVTLVDSAGRMAADWFKMLSELVNAVNKSSIVSSSASDSVTGTTDLTESASATVTIGKAGKARLSMAFSTTNNANSKTAVVKIGSTVIQTITMDASTDTQSAELLIVGMGQTQYTSPVGLVNCTGSGGVSTSVDLGAATTISVSLQLGTTTDTIALESWALSVEQA